ncbi:hypothetical protein BLA39750_00279 [Burkholderia lata]|uniref:Lipoprotein n=1 Tax=Burkholderia lata (strain ATCC 17760 / DSM 23089 / LMG 22485 / NCIMB 9086 / R18194 / 383) TaxID=482957 RepID=A0A6P2UBL0_BURL3|nr:hypothetical protein [Burkholderia lata]VWC67453.1 hypothetical protein BLA39750_00279 [Burkholderia lata]
MHPRSRFALGAALSALSVLFVSACGGNDVTDTPSSSSPPPSTTPSLASNSLQALVYGAPDTSVPAGTNVPVTMMGQMRALFDLIRKSPDFTQVVMDLGDGTPVHVLDTNTGDKFLPGKLALGLSYILIDMKSKNDPQYASYLATYQTITTAMMAQSGSNYTYANTSWGEYYYLVALNNLKAHGMLNEVFSDAMLATLQQRLTFCDMFGPDASGKTDTCPATGTPIDIASLNTAQNYYAVSYGIAGLRQKLGWSSPTFASKTDASVATMGARDALLYTLTNHIRNDSSGGFSDEASNTHTTYYDQARFDRYSTLLIGEVTERTFEMGNEANLTPELKGYLRKSVDLILPQLNADGQGFNYGRSIGPYGDSAFMEVLTAAANAGVLSDQEKQVAYAFIYQAAHRFDTYWYDPSLPTPSVNMWVKGRGTDAYRGKPRVMGENFSLLHQYLYVNAWWNKLGFGGKAPMADADYNAWLDALPHYTLTWYNQPGDTAHPYSAALVTVRDGRRVINLNLSQAPDYNSYTPYYPVPFSDKLIYGTTDLGYALLVPQVSYNGKTYIPVTYYKNLNVQQSNGQVIVSFDTAKFRLASKNAAYTTDLDLQVHTVLTFAHGSVARSDTLSTGTLTGNLSVETDFTSFADFASTQANGDGVSVTYSNSAATGYAASGFDTCALSAFDTANGTTNPLSTTPIGQLHSNFACTTKPFALGTGATRTFGWTLKYADPA